MIRARKRFGQHFLEPAWVDKLVAAIDPHPDEAFLEIGPGRGALTRPLAARAQSIVAYEIDRDLARELRISAPPNVTVIEADFLEVSAPAPSTLHPPSLASISGELRRDLAEARSAEAGQALATVRVAANLPYNVASPILFKLVELFRAGLPIRDATVMLQREVADRLVAEPGGKEYGVLSILIRHNAVVERLFNLPAGAFRPAPKVLSSVVRLRFHDPDPPVADQRAFEALVQAVFTRRRKTIANALLAYDRSSRLEPAPALARAGIDGRRRPETLAIGELARLADVFSSV
jgi:16S rRNA (adenine1518-N6/adenine1519-N6)-dimethyltransferase